MATPDPNGPDAAAQAAADLVHKRIGSTIGGRYRVISLIGEGGMGAVYQVEHTLIRKRMALKVLNPDLMQNPEMVTRFEREALAAVRPLLAEAEDDREACGLLERIVVAAHTQEKERHAALDLLRAHYDATGRPREVIRVLEQVIDLDPTSSQALREEAGARLAELDDDQAAMDHYAALLALTPDSSVTQEKLRQLAQRSNNYAGYATGVAAAAARAATVGRKVELLSEAARTRLDLLDDAAGAIELYQQALGLEGAGAKEQLHVSRRLSELYSRVDRPRERFETLEKLAQLEPAPATKKAVIGDAARLAETLGETDRALALWRQRIANDGDDLAALDAVIALLEHAQRWPELIAALDVRAGKQVSAAQRRADLTRIAVVQRDHVGDVPAAIAAWQRVAATFGDDPENVGALTELFASVGRWSELADLLERTSSGDVERTTARLNRLGQALAEHLDQPARALAAFRGALAIDSIDHPVGELFARLGSHVQAFGGAAAVAPLAHAVAKAVHEITDWLLAHLYSQATLPEYQCRFRWEPHSVAFWDNRCTQHAQTDNHQLLFFSGQRRRQRCFRLHGGSCGLFCRLGRANKHALFFDDTPVDAVFQAADEFNTDTRVRDARDHERR